MRRSRRRWRRASSTTGNRASRPSASSWRSRSPTSSRRKFVARMKALRVGDPMDDKTELGPLANADAVDVARRRRAEDRRCGREGAHRRQAAEARRQLLRADGAGEHSEGFAGLSRGVFRSGGVPVSREEISTRPSGSQTTADSVWAPARGPTTTAERERFINELEAGMVFINKMVASDPRLPFGGVKHSGHGRELGVHGIREFTNIKTVWIQ